MRHFVVLNSCLLVKFFQLSAFLDLPQRGFQLLQLPLGVAQMHLQGEQQLYTMATLPPCSSHDDDVGKCLLTVHGSSSICAGMRVRK